MLQFFIVFKFRTSLKVTFYSGLLVVGVTRLGMVQFLDDLLLDDLYLITLRNAFCVRARAPVHRIVNLGRCVLCENVAARCSRVSYYRDGLLSRFAIADSGRGTCNDHRGN